MITRQRPAPCAGGFTLLEMLVAMAIAAVLVALALPPYREHVARGRRSDAQLMLLSAAQDLQRWYASHNTYAGTATEGVSLLCSPSNGLPNYRLDVSERGPVGYTLTAVRVSSGAMANDRCGDLTYDQFGTKGIVHQAERTQAIQCWH